MEFTEEQIQRYSRHILLPEVGGTGQEKLAQARVLVVGAGGLGAPLLLYLAGAGIGTIGVIDDDSVELSNLQRQVIHDTGSIGRPKVESAAGRALAINPGIRLIPITERLTAANALATIRDFDIVADGTDNFATRFLLNDACFLAGRPLVSAALLRFDGQLSTFKAHLGEPNPCYRCLYPEPPPRGLIPSCSEAGVLGALAGTIGCLQATEVLKEILGIGTGLSGRLLMVNALDVMFRTVRLPRDPDCPLCGRDPRYRDLSHHEEGPT